MICAVMKTVRFVAVGLKILNWQDFSIQARSKITRTQSGERQYSGINYTTMIKLTWSK